MSRSIRWSLLFWYALIFVVVIVVFGTMLSFSLWQSMIGEVDAQLRAHAESLGGGLEGTAGNRFELALSEEYARYFSQKGEGVPYYVIWRSDGEVVDFSDGSLNIPRPQDSGSRDREGRREVVVPGLGNTLVLVGQGIRDQQKRLQAFLGQALATGATALILALIGGWFLAGRALAPVARMSKTASEISATNLSKRIDMSHTASELGQLARTLNEAFDRLQAAFDRQTRFTADASHELRTPLSILMSHAELALRKERGAAEYRDTIETCLKAAQRMKAVVEGLLTLARADSGELRLQKESLEFHRLVEETVDLLKPLAAQRNVTLFVQVVPARVMGDRDRLREVLMNLISNAIRYNRDAGTVHVSVQDADGTVVLTVADTGMGIPQKDQAHLFERFYRVDKARSREMGGTGLGLAITKWIVEAHGGGISFTSAEGVGTTFIVTFARAV